MDKNDEREAYRLGRIIYGRSWDMFPWILFSFVCGIIVFSIVDFIRTGSAQKGKEVLISRFSVELFYTLLVLYLTIIIGFGLIYFILSFQGIILVEHNELRQVSTLGTFLHSIYFSGVTLLTIGYGDIAPIGIGRFIAVTEALIGYVLPAAF